MFSYLKSAAVSIGLINSDERNQEIRDWYNEKVSQAYINKFQPIYQDIHSNQQSISHMVVNEAIGTRNEIKYAARTNNTVAENMILNLRDYFAGSKASHKKNPEDLAYSAFKTGGADLGLTNNNFYKIVDTYKSIAKKIDPSDSGIYPEAITAEQADQYLNYVASHSVEESIEYAGIVGLYSLQSSDSDL